MAAGEDQSKSVFFVLERRLRLQIHGALWNRGFELIPKLILLVPTSSMAAPVVNQFPASRGCNPGARVTGNTLCRPVNQSGGECILQCLFRQIERLRNTDQACNDASALAAEDRFNCPVQLVHSCRCVWAFREEDEPLRIPEPPGRKSEFWRPIPRLRPDPGNRRCSSRLIVPSFQQTDHP